VAKSGKKKKGKGNKVVSTVCWNKDCGGLSVKRKAKANRAMHWGSERKKGVLFLWWGGGGGGLCVCVGCVLGNVWGGSEREQGGGLVGVLCRVLIARLFISDLGELCP